MSKGPVHLVATIYPRDGKVERASFPPPSVVELLTGMAKFVQENEPNTLRYQLHREINKKTGVDDLVMLESYTDMAAVKAHGSTKEFREFYKTVAAEDLVTGPTKLVWLKAVSGFGSRL